MKILLIVIIVIAGLFFIAQAYFIMATKKTPAQHYKVIFSDNNFEIRFYPSITMASIVSSVKSYKELGNTGFRKLAGYIFGGNESKTQIAMTTPVHMDINDTASSMSFVMPENYDVNNLPKPDNTEVRIQTTNDEYVAAIGFGGYANDAKIKNYTIKLLNALKENGIEWYGNIRFLGYNPPFQLLNRKNELIISVRWPK